MFDWLVAFCTRALGGAAPKRPAIGVAFNEGADREDNTAILVVQQALMLWFSVDYFVRGQAIYSGWWLEGNEKWTCAWGYTVSIVMYKKFTLPMWYILLQ